MLLARRIVCLLACAALTVPAIGASRIGLLLKGRSPFWAAVEKGARDAADKAGVDLIVKAPPTENDIAIQIALLRALSHEGIQALVIAPTDADSLASPVAAVAAAGIKVVVIDSPLSGSAASVFIGTDQHAAGEAAGAFLASVCSPTDEVALFRHNQTGGATLLREAGALEKLRALRPNEPIHADIYASAGGGTEAEHAEFLLSKYPNVKGILATGTPGTMAMLNILSQRGRNAIKLVGFGFNLNPVVVEALQQGTMTGWVAQLPAEVGAKGVTTAVALVGGQSVPSKISTDFLVVTKDNLSDPKVQALLTL